jgi:anti-sigma regulatory factor (Ser/Thr protein kinase)
MTSGAASPVDGRLVHPALFYSDAAEYLAGTVPFILGGLAADEPVAVAVPRPNLELLRAELGPAAARVQMADMGEVGRNPGRILAEVLHAAADAHPGRYVRIIGEPIWPGRSELEYPACLQHEALINFAFRDRPATILCPYDAAGLDAAVLDDAAQTHPELIERGARRRSDAYAPEQAIVRSNGPLPAPTRAEVFHFDAPRLSAARRFAGAAAERAGIGDRLEDFVLVIGELAANSIRHGRGRGTLKVWVDDGRLAAEVHDAGVLRDPLVGRRRPDPAGLSGRGLAMVNHLADLVRTHTGPDGTTTQVYLQL